MPFDVLPTIVAETRKTYGSISYKRNARSKNKKSPPRLIICLPALLNNGLIHDGDRVQLLVGSGKDAGHGLLVKANGKGDGITAHSIRGGAILLRFGYVPMLGSDPAEREPLDFQAVAEGLMFPLPPWFKGHV
jgi:hypothetical protein